MDYTKINSETIDRWVEEGWEWGQPISHEVYQRALEGEWELLLTPTRPVPQEWIGDVKGAKVLGLASGGGQQMPIFAALGAEGTVLDNSAKQLENDYIVASREGFDLRIMKADMTLPLPFADEEFDLIFYPVSNVYIEDVHHVWQEAYRILKPGGTILSGLDNGVNFIVDEREDRVVHKLPFNPLKDEEQMRFLQKTDSGVQFSHTLEDQIQGQISAGFILKELYEDTNGEGRLHELNIPSFFATRSVKPDVTTQED